MNQSFDVLIVGGGIVGLSAAIGMRLRGYSVAVVDAGALSIDTPANDTRVYAINQASERLLTSLGAWSNIEPSRLSPYRQMHVWDASNKACIDFDARMIGAARLGLIVQESVIKNALLIKAFELDITFFPDTRIDSVQATEKGIILAAQDKNWEANLLIVADGAQSVTRQMLNVPITTWPYHQHAIVATIETEKPHQETAYQVFNPQGPLAFLPLTDSHQCSIVWSTSTAHAQALMALSDADFATELTTAFAGKLGRCEVLSRRQQFPLQMRHVERYSGTNWLIMGDAAHTIHPLAGLGLNVGLADLNTWLTNMDDTKSKRWTSKMLGAYQRQRKTAVWQTIVLMSGLKTIFSNPTPPFVTLRGLGLNACNQLSPLKRLFIEHASK